MTCDVYLSIDYKTLKTLTSLNKETLGRTLWALLGPCPGVTLSGLFSDSSGVPARRARETPVWGRADRNPNTFFLGQFNITRSAIHLASGLQSLSIDRPEPSPEQALLAVY